MRIRRVAGPVCVVAVLATAAAAVAQENSPAGDAATRLLYQNQCATCHGADGTPRPIAKTAPRFTDPAWAPTIETIVGVLTDGKNQKMPKFKGRLTPDEMQALATFLRRMKDAPKPD